ncbi:CLUMA_CG005740, isoform A [Clunio marinus]|uniref:Alkaline phosphatase n=1 Tax=Clunio marinus TaxID=568069 RepID=A0A1J1HX88_9DIPT|nr:CLUMA_CG005740, isoform A [Clunio marinus]
MTGIYSDANNEQEWEFDDPRWYEKIPNWWDEKIFVPPNGPEKEKQRKFWVDHGQNLLKKKIINTKLNMNKVKNLVIFIGDGMGISTQMATRAYIGDVRSELSFEKFPFSGMSKTYCINYQVSDSACTATAILSGIKNNFNVLGLTGDVNLRNCTAQQDKSKHVDSIFKYAQDAGLSTGFVTNTRITHATLAAVYAKSASRYWESNEGVPDGCHDIAHQLIHGEIGSKLDVIMGGGRRSFLPNTNVNQNSERGFRTDNRNLIDEYKENQRKQFKRFSYVQNRNELKAIDIDLNDRILGIFAHSHMEYQMLSDTNIQPTLTEMTAKALEIMKKNEKGFVLLVESGRIDHAHHQGRARLALEETVEFDKVVDYVNNITNEEDTLTIVTADHSHVFTVGGYPPRNRNILGVGDFSRAEEKWFFTLNYANGPGHKEHAHPTGGRQNPRGMRYMDPFFRQPATIQKEEETHAGEDVGVYANGPYAHLFSGVYEQSYLAHAMTYATCLGPKYYEKNVHCTDGAAHLSYSSVFVITVINVIILL